MADSSEDEISDDNFDEVSDSSVEQKNKKRAIDLEREFTDGSESAVDEDPDAVTVLLTDDEDDNDITETETRNTEIPDADYRIMEMYRISQKYKLPELNRREPNMKECSHDEQEKYQQILDIRLRYMKEFHLPPVLFLSGLEKRASAHLSICNYILSGRLSSLYYTHAKELQVQSRRDVLTTADLRNANLLKFTAGYFGLKRQAIVGMLILERYREELTHNKNPVVTFWGPSDFANYVLAPEVLCYLCMEDFHLTDIEDAWEIMQNTTEFGTKVADNDPLEVFEIEIEEKLMERLRLGAEYSSMSYRNDPRNLMEP